MYIKSGKPHKEFYFLAYRDCGTSTIHLACEESNEPINNREWSDLPATTLNGVSETTVGKNARVLHKLSR